MSSDIEEVHGTSTLVVCIYRFRILHGQRVMRRCQTLKDCAVRKLLTCSPGSSFHAFLLFRGTWRDLHNGHHAADLRTQCLIPKSEIRSLLVMKKPTKSPCHPLQSSRCKKKLWRGVRIHRLLTFSGICSELCRPF